MQIRKTSKSGLFILELIIILLFFSVTGAICIRLFAHSALLSNKSTDISIGSIKVQSAAEVFKATNGDSKQICNILNGTEKDNIISIGYTKNFAETTTLDNAEYILDIVKTENNNMIYGDISIKKQDTVIFAINTATYNGTQLKGAD